MYFDSMKLCGRSCRGCRNWYCSGNPDYRPPKRKVKPKGGPGKPCKSLRAKIRKDDGRGFSAWYESEY